MSVFEVTEVTIKEPREWVKDPSPTQYKSILGHSYRSQEIAVSGAESSVTMTIFTDSLNAPLIPTPADIDRAAERAAYEMRRATHNTIIRQGLIPVLRQLECADLDETFEPLHLLAHEIQMGDADADHLQEVARDLHSLANKRDDTAPYDSKEEDACNAYRCISELVLCDSPGHWLSCAAISAARAAK